MVLGSILWLIGLAGCVLPLLPGLPVVYGALVIQQFRAERPFSAEFLVLWAGLIAVALLVEYGLPAYTTKKYGGSRGGTWGATLGLLLGFFFGPWGLILGPFVGAFLGEWAQHQRSEKAWRAAWGSFVGFLLGTVLKLVMAGVMGWYLVQSFLS